MHVKKFDEWNVDKKLLEKILRKQQFSNGEVWWVKFGVNVGSEQDGIGQSFERPIVIIKKFSSTTFLCVPLTTKEKDIKYRTKLSANNKISYAIIDQVRVLDSKRLIRKIGEADIDEFKVLKFIIRSMF